MKTPAFALLALVAASVFLAGCESPRPAVARQPHGAPATWESGSPMLSGMGTTNR